MCDSFFFPLPHLSVISMQESAHPYLLVYLAALCLNVACFIPGNVFYLAHLFLLLGEKGWGEVKVEVPFLY